MMRNLRTQVLLSMVGLAAFGLGLGCSDDTQTGPVADVGTPDVGPSDVQADTSDNPCSGQPEGAACDDGDPCTLDDQCSAGQCVGGTNDTCESDDACMVGTCVSGEGCKFEAAPNDTSCSMACFETASCQEGSCVVDPDTKVSCPAVTTENGCIESLECDPDTGECTLEIPKPEGTACDSDDDLCSPEVCSADGICEAAGDTNDCSAEKAENVCETWVCDPKDGACKSTGFVGEISCDDGNACTSNDTCKVDDFNIASCLGTPIPFDDNNPCTDDSCKDGEIIHKPINGLACDPEDPCSPEGTCTEGICESNTQCECTLDIDCPQPENKCLGVAFCDASGDKPVCAIKPESIVVCEGVDSDCEVNECVPATGKCVVQPIDDGTVCNDGNACTLADTCKNGVCGGGENLDCSDGLYCNGKESCDPNKGCQPGNSPDTDDGIECTVDACDEDLDAVTHTPNNAVCDNGQYCDGKETCDVSKGCLNGDAPSLDDGMPCTKDSCDEEADVVIHTPDNAFCDNGEACDGKETCDAQKGCMAGDAPDLDDGIACTVDSCDAETGLPVHVPDDSLCDNKLYCDGLETCDAQKGCVPGKAPELSDGVECTVDTCDEEVDAIKHTPKDAFCDNGQFCDGLESCDVQKGCMAGKAPEVSDGVACTQDSCDEANDVIVNAVDDAFCNNGQFCDGLETCDKALDCQSGDAPVVDDGVDCTKDSCDEEADKVVHMVDDAFCDNGQFCDGSETCDAQKGCLAGEAPEVSDGVGCTKDSCDEVNDIVVHEADDSACDDGDVCTKNICDLKSDCDYPVLANDTPCGDGFWCQEGICVDKQICGNGQVEEPEVCDDGAQNGQGDGLCLAECEGVQTCGDGNIQGTEVCDDGALNESADGTCVSDCSGLQVCGNDVVEGSEDCDGANCCACTDDEVNPNQCVLANTTGSEFEEISKLVASDGASSDAFGTNVSISGDAMIVGSVNDDDKGNASGSAYVYTRLEDGWGGEQKLLASDGDSGDWFGGYVSIDGDTLVVGSYYDGDNGYASGSAYVFTQSDGVWTEQQKLLASDGAANDWLGRPVSISGDTVVAGAYGKDDNGSVSGSAYVFVRKNGVWSEEKKLLASDGAASDQFGASVGISGNIVVVGANFDDDKGDKSGSAYVYVRSNGNWTEQQKLVPGDGEAKDYFGHSVAIDGETLAVGAIENDEAEYNAGAVYVYTRENGQWVLEQKLTASDAGLGDEFGFSVSISGDRLVIGTYASQTAGAAYVFERTNGVWTEKKKLSGKDTVKGDRFGHSVSIRGAAIAVGAKDDDDKGSASGGAYVFEGGSPNCLTVDTCECKPGYVGSTCADTACGDGITAGDEVCDDGEQNGSGVGSCNADCTAVQDCGPKTDHGGHTYFACEGPKRQVDAAQRCVQEGGYQLAQPDTEDEDTFILGLLSDVGTDRGWTRLKKFELEGKYTDWHPSKPDQHGDCVLTRQMGWSNEFCDDPGHLYGFTCESTEQVCGNGSVEAGEQCDDGNEVDGDGCDASCKSEAFASCNEALLLGAQSDDGLYLIDPDSSGPMAPVKLHCDMAGGGWSLVGNYFDSPGDDMPNTTDYVVSGWQQTASGKWSNAASVVDAIHGNVASSAVSLAFVDALVQQAGQSNLKICFVHKEGYNTKCRQSSDGSLTLVGMNTGNPKLAPYTNKALVFAFGRLAGLAGSNDGYNYSDYPYMSFCVPRDLGGEALFGFYGSGLCENSYVAGDCQGVWHGDGCGSSYRPSLTNNNELGACTTSASCKKLLGPDPTPEAYGFRLYVGP